MSSELISRSADLQQLRDEGYDFDVRSDGFLLIRHVPYLNSQKAVRYGLLQPAIEPPNRLIMWSCSQANFLATVMGLRCRG
jgi:hypothetical protein